MKKKTKNREKNCWAQKKELNGVEDETFFGVHEAGRLINDDDSLCRVFAWNNLTNLGNQPRHRKKDFDKKNRAGFIFCDASFFSIETFGGKKFVKRRKKERIFGKGLSIHNPRLACRKMDLEF